MKVRVAALVAALLLAVTGTVRAQSQTGEIFGKVTDESGAILPGVTVTVTGPVLLQPLTAATSETGTFQFPRLAVGTYQVKFELPGFKTIVREDIRVTVGFSANVSTQLGVSAIQETVTVSGESPVVDTKEVGTKQTFTTEMLQSIPSARDPWVILQQTAGIAMDRENVGGNMSGQQSNYISRGANPTNNKWSLDGVDITDMSATGASPSYYDFDAFQEMTISTGGVDVTQQTGGVGINLVTKSGSDRFRGSARYLVTDDSTEANNISDALRKQGASSGNPIQNNKDYGVEAGGPIKRGRAWVWGSYGKQDINVGVIGFYKPDAACQTIKREVGAAPLSHSVEEINKCLMTDKTLLQATNLKGEIQLFKGNKVSLFNNFAKKERNARGADDLHPIETTTPQGAVPGSFGKHWWNTGPNPTYKFGDQWVVNDRLLMDVQYAHVGNNFVLGFHEPGLRDVQPTLIVSSGMNGRSGSESVFIRPVNSLTFNANYFMPGFIGGDHALKFGGYWRDSNTTSIGHTGGFGTVRFPNDSSDCTVSTGNCQVDLTRDNNAVYDLVNYAAYVQDTLTHGRATFQLGVRYDYIQDKALASSIAANPLGGPWLPSLNFPGADPGVAFNNFSPRVGLTYDLSGSGKTIARANYARYFGQVGNGGIAGTVNPVGTTTLRYPWVDANKNGSADVGEITLSANPISASTNWSAANPANTVSANSVDKNLKNDTTDEFIVGVDREIGRGFAVGANYIWRRYSNFSWSDRQGIASSDWLQTSFTPPASTCPGDDGLRISAGNCQTITFFSPAFQQPTVVTLTNIPDFNRSYNGIELTGRKRMSNHWMMNTSFAYNATSVNYGSFPGSQPSIAAATISEDPSNRDKRNGFEYDYLTGGSGIGNVYVNAKWLFKISGLYELPLGINASAFYNTRQGYPQEISIQTPACSTTVTTGCRGNGAAQIDILLNPVGDVRLPNFQNLDFHLERPISFGGRRFIPSFDVFNVGNWNTIQAIRSRQNTASATAPGNANQIQAILAPRVVRFGVKVVW
jgi:Carboxypeptidase regulatory-like domain/TonB-dependent Receptor Plug Domain